MDSSANGAKADTLSATHNNTAATTVVCQKDDELFKKPTKLAPRVSRKRRLQDSKTYNSSNVNQTERTDDTEGLRRSKRVPSTSDWQYHSLLKSLFYPTSLKPTNRTSSSSNNESRGGDLSTPVASSTVNDANVRKRTRKPKKTVTFSYLGDTNITSSTVHSQRNTESEALSAQLEAIPETPVETDDHEAVVSSSMAVAPAPNDINLPCTSSSITNQNMKTTTKASETTTNRNKKTGATGKQTAILKKRGRPRKAVTGAKKNQQQQQQQQQREEADAVESAEQIPDDDTANRTGLLECSRVYLPPPPSLEKLNEMFDELKNAANNLSDGETMPNGAESSTSTPTTDSNVCLRPVRVRLRRLRTRDATEEFVLPPKAFSDKPMDSSANGAKADTLSATHNNTAANTLVCQKDDELFKKPTKLAPRVSRKRRLQDSKTYISSNVNQTERTDDTEGLRRSKRVPSTSNWNGHSLLKSLFNSTSLKPTNRTSYISSNVNQTERTDDTEVISPVCNIQIPSPPPPLGYSTVSTFVLPSLPMEEFVLPPTAFSDKPMDSSANGAKADTLSAMHNNTAATTVVCQKDDELFKKPTKLAPRVSRKRRLQDSKTYNSSNVNQTERTDDTEGLRRSKRVPSTSDWQYHSLLKSLFYSTSLKPTNRTSSSSSNESRGGDLSTPVASSTVNDANVRKRTRKPKKTVTFSYLGDTNITSSTVHSQRNTESEALSAQLEAIPETPIETDNHEAVVSSSMAVAPAPNDINLPCTSSSITNRNMKTTTKASETTTNRNKKTGATGKQTAILKKRGRPRKAVTGAKKNQQQQQQQQQREEADAVEAAEQIPDDDTANRTGLLECSRVYLPPPPSLEKLNEMFDELKNAANNLSDGETMPNGAESSTSTPTTDSNVCLRPVRVRLRRLRTRDATEEFVLPPKAFSDKPMDSSANGAKADTLSATHNNTAANTLVCQKDDELFKKPTKLAPRVSRKRRLQDSKTYISSNVNQTERTDDTEGLRRSKRVPSTSNWNGHSLLKSLFNSTSLKPTNRTSYISSNVNQTERTDDTEVISPVCNIQIPSPPPPLGYSTVSTFVLPSLPMEEFVLPPTAFSDKPMDSSANGAKADTLSAMHNNTAATTVVCQKDDELFKKPTKLAPRVSRKRRLQDSKTYNSSNVNQTERTDDTEGLRRSKRVPSTSDWQYHSLLKSLFYSTSLKPTNRTSSSSSNESRGGDLSTPVASSRVNDANVKKRTRKPKKTVTFSYLGDTNITSSTVHSQRNTESEALSAQLEAIPVTPIETDDHEAVVSSSMAVAPAPNDINLPCTSSSITNQNMKTTTKASETTTNRNKKTGATGKQTAISKKRGRPRKAVTGAKKNQQQQQQQQQREEADAVEAAEQIPDDDTANRTGLLECSRVYLPPPPSLEKLNEMFDELKNAANNLSDGETMPNGAESSTSTPTTDSNVCLRPVRVRLRHLRTRDANSAESSTSTPTTDSNVCLRPVRVRLRRLRTRDANGAESSTSTPTTDSNV
ncbi:putative mediator of RNA polymerase II transcription subunit 26 isoform X1 [Bactrocera dorsalis]|uniref:Mediator of RNA polymerase II transcription subunit 26 isoform X1 n=1 Tax=Bactrocera dorsalis TaxID=27457 RepID=A0ABM3JFP9_BACDO|nr:putative mediator of RNA polymerase II transcription subunit 26 isoform X1 [Bactrocera dorsalis]